MAKIPQRLIYLLTEVGCLSLSFVGVYYAAYHSKAIPHYSDGGRGGAVAVMLAFAILFLRRSYGARLFEELTGRDLPALRSEFENFRDGQPYPQISEEKFHIIRKHVIAIVNRMGVEADGQGTQNRSLAWASCIGTFFWGFGDIAAGKLQGGFPEHYIGMLSLLVITVLYFALRLAMERWLRKMKHKNASLQTGSDASVNQKA